MNTNNEKGPGFPRLAAQEAYLMEEVEDSPDFWSGLVQSYNSPVEHSFLIGLDWSTNGPLPEILSWVSVISK